MTPAERRAEKAKIFDQRCADRGVEPLFELLSDDDRPGFWSLQTTRLGNTPIVCNISKSRHPTLTLAQAVVRAKAQMYEHVDVFIGGSDDESE